MVLVRLLWVVWGTSYHRLCDFTAWADLSIQNGSYAPVTARGSRRQHRAEPTRSFSMKGTFNVKPRTEHWDNNAAPGAEIVVGTNVKISVWDSCEVTIDMTIKEL